jgi:Tol biopolymer transport system component
MKRDSKIILFTILTTMLLSSNTPANNAISDVHLNLTDILLYDTTNAKRFIEVDSFRLQIIPPSSGVQFYKDGIVFLSSSKNESKMPANHLSFGNIEAYYASLGDSALGRHVLFSSISSFSYPCEAMTFSKDYKTIYFTGIPKKDKKEKIFMAKFVPDSKNQKDSVMQIIPLSFCSDNYNYSHPTLSSNGNTLIFASDREGSLGGMDLFISRRTGENWSLPENLGESINTTGNEFFPYLDLDNNLYFSSDKLPGYGGYDIFSCKFNGTNWGKPINLSDGINSEKDEIAFTIDKIDRKTAFFTRRQLSGKKEMQLFRVTMTQQAADKNTSTLSYLFNGKSEPKTSFIAATSEADLKPAASETSKRKSATESVKKEEVIVPKASSSKKKITEKVTSTKPAPKATVAENKTVETKSSQPVTVEQKEVVIYRVQLLPNSTQKKSKEMEINGKKYKLYDYLYLGTYRYTIGEFSTLSSAVELQRICRQSGYPQSFVIAFKNNIRSLDPKLFK